MQVYFNIFKNTISSNLFWITPSLLLILSYFITSRLMKKKINNSDYLEQINKKISNFIHLFVYLYLIGLAITFLIFIGDSINYNIAKENKYEVIKISEMKNLFYSTNHATYYTIYYKTNKHDIKEKNIYNWEYIYGTDQLQYDMVTKKVLVPWDQNIIKDDTYLILNKKEKISKILKIEIENLFDKKYALVTYADKNNIVKEEKATLLYSEGKEKIIIDMKKSKIKIYYPIEYLDN